MPSKKYARKIVFLSKIFTKDEAKNLLAELETAHPQLHDMALLSLRTGLRCTELFKLKGQDVDTNAGILHIIAKGGKRTTESRFSCFYV